MIIPIIQADALNHYHGMTGGQFLNAVALGQITPGPVVLTVAVVGYAAAGIVGGVLAATVAFAPSFAFIPLGARHFGQLRNNQYVRTLRDGAGSAAMGTILGSAVVLSLPRRGVVPTLLAAATTGIAITAFGGALPH